VRLPDRERACTMSSITVIGSGNMARGIGARAVAADYDLQILDRDANKAAALAEELGAGEAGAVGDALTGEIVVLAVPFEAASDVVSLYAGALDRKVLVDITNPVDFSTFAGLTVPIDTSGAQEITKAAPTGTRVIKAFNTTFAGPLVNGEVDGEVLDVLMAGDDDDAKATLAAFVEAAGLRPIDVGGLSMAHWLEGLGLIGMAVAAESGNWGRIIKFLG